MKMAAGDNSQRITVTLNLTTVQYDAVSQLFQQSQWDLEEARVPSNSLDISGSEGVDMAADSTSQCPEYSIPPVNGQQRCPFCFCCPCITDESNRQFWWENQNQLPHERNSEKRKKNYKKFWTMMHHRGAWNYPLYLTKKQQALGADPQRRRYIYIYHRRDIMPDCVIKLVRTWLPNLASMPYMGHLWE